MNLCNECGVECAENEVIRYPEGVIEYKCDYCFQDAINRSKEMEDEDGYTIGD